MVLRKALPLFVTAVLIFSAAAAGAGETRIYLKPGYFSWDEEIDGRSFIKERGLVTSVGITHRHGIAGRFTLGETLELWGGNIDYDGHDITNTTPIKTDTIYLGTREEVEGGYGIPLSESLSVSPVAAAGHKFWVRTRSNEDWNMIYGRFGGAATYTAPGSRVFVKGGITLPFFTRSHVILNSVLFDPGEVTTSPKGRLAPFAEGGIETGPWSVSVGYESFEFDQSDPIPVRSITSLPNGVAVVNSQAFQPKSSTSLVSLRIDYRF